jgi:hypothetical protein
MSIGDGASFLTRSSGTLPASETSTTQAAADGAAALVVEIHRTLAMRLTLCGLPFALV